MSVEVDAMSNSAVANKNGKSATTALIRAVAAQYAAVKTDPVKVQALSDELNSSAGSLANACCDGKTP